MSMTERQIDARNFSVVVDGAKLVVDSRDTLPSTAVVDSCATCGVDTRRILPEMWQTRCRVRRLALPSPSFS
jgi:hypothetical protein